MTRSLKPRFQGWFREEDTPFLRRADADEHEAQENPDHAEETVEFRMILPEGIQGWWREEDSPLLQRADLFEYAENPPSSRDKTKSRSGVMRYTGSKGRMELRRWLQFAFHCVHPHHTQFVEAFVGSGGIFFHKSPVASEALNDGNPLIMAIYYAMVHSPKKLHQRLLDVRPVATETLESAQERSYKNALSLLKQTTSLLQEKPLSAKTPLLVDLAAAKLLVHQFSWGGKGHGTFAAMKASSWDAYCSAFPHYAERLAKSKKLRLSQETWTSQGEMPLLDALRTPAYHTPQTLLYLDPPYAGTYQGAYKEGCPTGEFTRQDLKKMLSLATLSGAAWVISGYSDTDDLFPRTWIRFQKVVRCGISPAKALRTEMLWCRLPSRF